MTDVPVICTSYPCSGNVSTYMIDGVNMTLEEIYYIDQSVNFWQVPQLILLVILFTMIVCGNMCVLIAISMSETGYKTRMNFFIINLSIADLSVGIFHVTVDIAEKCFVVWYGGPALCKIVRFMQVLVIYASTFMLVALSIDRVDAIARPMNFRRKATTVRALVNTAWIASCLLAIPSFLLFDTVSNNGQMYCMITLTQRWYWQLYITLVALIAFILPALIIITCYSIIVCVVWEKGRGFKDIQTTSGCSNCHQGANGGGNKGIIPQAKIRTLKMTLIIVCVFVLSWCPYFVFNLIDVYSDVMEKSNTDLAVTSLFQSLAPLNSAANPIIYGIFGTKICKHLKRLPCVKHISDWFCRCRLKSTIIQTRNGAQSNTDTCADITSATCLHSRQRPAANGNRKLISNERVSSLNHHCCRGELLQKRGLVKMDSDSKLVVKSPNNRTCAAAKRNNTQAGQSCLQNRRPSGLPLVNRRMTPNDVIMLETYRCVQVSNSRVECDAASTEVAVCATEHSLQKSALKINNIHRSVSNV